MRKNLALWVSMLFMLAGCCPITSLHPLPSSEAPIDGRLVGLWQLDAKDDKVFLHIGRAEGGRVQVVLVEHKTDGTLKQAVFDLSTATIGQQSFFTLDLDKVAEDQKEGHDGHIILKYSLSDAYTLSLYRLDLDTVAAAVISSQLAGEIEYDRTSVMEGEETAANEKRKVACARITADPDHLAAFITRKPSGDRFQPYLNFKRLPCVPVD